MVISTSHVILLGNFADADSNEVDLALEDTSPYLGSFGSSGAPLSDSILEVTYDDSDNSGGMNTDNSSGEQISYDAGAGPVTTVVDSLVVCNVTVTYSDGSTQSFSNAVMYQDATGNMFLTNSNFAGTDLNGPNNMPIDSVNVTAITGSAYSGLFQNALQDFVCFAYGTRIRTPDGERPVEGLETGDLVMTQDHGPQPIRWIGRRIVRAVGNLHPVRIRAGALGLGLPGRDLLLSQQHRVLVRSPIVRRMFEVDEALVPVKRLDGLPGIAIDRSRRWLGYAHILLDRHEVVLAEGAPVESLLPGVQALKSMGDAACDEVLSIFPELAEQSSRPESARCIPGGAQQRRLVERHRKNKKAILSTGALPDQWSNPRIDGKFSTNCETLSTSLESSLLHCRS